MKPGDRRWIWQGDTGLVEVDITLVFQTYAAIGEVVGTGQKIPHSYERFQTSRLAALEAAREGAMRRVRQYGPEVLSSALAAGTVAALDELLRLEREGEVAS